MELFKNIYVYAIISALCSVNLMLCQRYNMTRDIQEATLCFMMNTAAKLDKLNSEDTQNILFSPIDLYASTALAYLGSGEKDKLALQKTLKLKKPRKTYRKKRQLNLELARHNAIGDLVKLSTKGSKQTAIESGKGIFVYNEYAIKNVFIQDAKEIYDVEVQCADFCNQPEPSTKMINDYVDKHSFDRIAAFFPDTVSTDTQSVITSSLTLLAPWKNMFQTNDTYETVFHSREDGCDDMTICVMMNQKCVPYYEDTEVSAIAVPFSDSRLSMYFVLPHEHVSLSEIVARRDKRIIENIVKTSETKKVTYHVPKILLEGQVDQLRVLNLAALRNITQDNVADNLTLTILRQKIFVEINEEGIGACPLERSLRIPSMLDVADDADSIQFVLDRPFIFFVYNSHAKTFLYYGVIRKPRSDNTNYV